MTHYTTLQLLGQHTTAQLLCLELLCTPADDLSLASQGWVSGEPPSAPPSTSLIHLPR